MNWFNVESLEELKSLGRFREVYKAVKDEVGNMGKINGRGWQTLFDSILIFKEDINKFSQLVPQEKLTIDEGGTYFISKAHEYIFYLLELDGEARVEKLGITKRNFTNKRIAKQWMRNISKEIHPDVCNHPSAHDAMAKLNSLYNGMLGNE